VDTCLINRKFWTWAALRSIAIGGFGFVVGVAGVLFCARLSRRIAFLGTKPLQTIDDDESRGARLPPFAL
jgi:hypothetical protein